MAEPDLPLWLITLFGWSASWWYSIIRTALAVSGVVLFLAGVLLGFGQFFRGSLIALSGAVLGPHMGMLIPMQWPVPACVGWAIAFGRAWGSETCDLYSGASTSYFLSPESLDAQQRVTTIQSSWPFTVVAWLAVLWGLWLFSEPVRRRLVIWWNQRRTK